MLIAHCMYLYICNGIINAKDRYGILKPVQCSAYVQAVHAFSITMVLRCQGTSSGFDFVLMCVSQIIVIGLFTEHFQKDGVLLNCRGTSPERWIIINRYVIFASKFLGIFYHFTLHTFFPAFSALELYTEFAERGKCLTSLKNFFEDSSNFEQFTRKTAAALDSPVPSTAGSQVRK